MTVDFKFYKPQVVEIETYEEAMSVVASLTEARNKSEKRWADLWAAYQEQSQRWVEESAKAIEAFEKAVDSNKQASADKDMLASVLFALEDLIKNKKVGWIQDAALKKLRKALAEGGQ